MRLEAMTAWAKKPGRRLAKAAQVRRPSIPGAGLLRAKSFPGNPDQYNDSGNSSIPGAGLPEGA